MTRAPDAAPWEDFADEAQVQRWTVDRLAPFCSDIIENRPLRGTNLQPDLTVRLHELPDCWFLIEIKRFSVARLSPLPEAIAQAVDYARRAGAPCFVGPLYHRGWTEWSSNPRAVAAIVASHFSVGILNFSWPNTFGGVGGLFLGNTWVAEFRRGKDGGAVTRLHEDAANLMRYKNRRGSQVMRGGRAA